MIPYETGGNAIGLFYNRQLFQQSASGVVFSDGTYERNTRAEPGGSHSLVAALTPALFPQGFSSDGFSGERQARNLGHKVDIEAAQYDHVRHVN